MIYYIHKMKARESTMTTYQLVQIANRTSTINPWVMGSLIALSVAFVVTAVVVMIKMW